MLKAVAARCAGILIVLSVLLLSEIRLSANGSNTAAENPPSVEIIKFSIRPATLNMYPGGSMQLIATAYDANGKKVTVNPEWIIRSDVSSLGEFDKSEGEKVIFSALNSGTGSIVAVYNDLEAEVRVKVFSRRK